MEDNLKILVCGGCYKPVTNVDIARCDGCGLAANYRTEYLASKAKQLYEYYQAEDNMRGGRTIYTVISGQISNLQTQAMHAQYLKNIKSQQQTAGAVAITQAVLGDAGAVFSAQAATDEGDPVEGFVMQVSDQVVSGKLRFKMGMMFTQLVMNIVEFFKQLQWLNQVNERYGCCHIVSVARFPKEKICSK